MLNKLIEDPSRVLPSLVSPKRGNSFGCILAYSVNIVGWDVRIDIPYIPCSRYLSFLRMW
jgi:hypothetical protein